MVTSYRGYDVSGYRFCSEEHERMKSRLTMVNSGFCVSCIDENEKGGPGASGRVLPPVTGRSRVRVAVSSHCTGEGKACH